MKLSKKMGSKGGVTIPQQLRHASGIMPGAPIDVEDAPGGGLIIKKHVPSCIICGGVAEVAQLNGVEICAACAATLLAKAKMTTETGAQNG